MTRYLPLCLLLLFGLFACGPADSHDSGSRDLSAVEFREGGFSVGSVSYQGSCAETAYETCRSQCSDCWDQCAALSSSYAADCAALCFDCDCSTYTDVCLDYQTELYLGPADPGLASACEGWSNALESACGWSRPQTFCETMAKAFKPDFAAVMTCSTEKALRGDCEKSCTFPTSTLGDDLRMAISSLDCSCYLDEPNLNLLGEVLRPDVVDAAWACLELDGCEEIRSCVEAWGRAVVPQ